MEKNYNEVKNENANYEKKNKQLEDIIDRLKAKYDALKEKKENEEKKGTN